MLQSLLGGMLIGVSASLAWGGARKITGISGIIGSALRRDEGSRFRLGFLFAFLLVSVLIGLIAPPTVTLTSRPFAWLLVAGLLVGFGTQLGRGCTSGHGVCGMSRLAPRSLIATLVFMVVAAGVVFITRHVLNLPGALE